LYIFGEIFRLALKIMLYCNAYEALISTSNSELSHILSERISLITDSDLTKRLVKYADLKFIYDIRSKTAHGSTIKKDKKLEHYCIIADEIARLLLWFYLEDDIFQEIIDTNDTEKINNYFLNLILKG